MTNQNQNEAVEQTISSLDTLNLAGLKAVQQALAEKMKQAQQREINSAVQRIQEIARSVGKSVDEIIGTGKFAVPAPVKYKHPDGRTWSGRGRQPGWVSEWLGVDGHTLDQLAV